MRLVDLLAVTLERVCIQRLRGTCGGAVYLPVFVSIFGKFHADCFTCRAFHPNAHPARKVLAKIKHAGVIIKTSHINRRQGLHHLDGGQQLGLQPAGGRVHP